MTKTTVLISPHNIIFSTHIYGALYYPILEAIASKEECDTETIEAKAEEKGIKKNSEDLFDLGNLCLALGYEDLYYEKVEEFLQDNDILIDGAIEMLSKLKDNNMNVGIVSSSMRRTIVTYMLHYDLLKYIDFMIFEDEYKLKKNNSKFWKMLLSKQELDAKNCLVCEDDEHGDCKIPESLGFHTFLIKGKSDVDRIAAKADTV